MQDKIITIVLQGSPAAYPVIVNNGTDTIFGKSLPYDQLAGYVTAAADEYGINQIKICSSLQYAEGLIEDIKLITQTQYANNNLEIEVVQL